MEDSKNELQPFEAERLSLIRYQLLLAEQQSVQPSPLNSIALGTMQDAVESMLSLVIEKRLLQTKNMLEFIQMFDAVSSSFSEESQIPGFRSSMFAMNKARVSFKHHGNQVEAVTIARHLSNTSDLLNQLCIEVFNIRFQEVSLLLFVRDEKARTHLQQSETLWNLSNFEEAIDELKLAFDQIIRDYDSRKSWSPGRGLFSTRPSFLPSTIERKAAGNTVQKAYEWLESIDEWVKILALGVDMRRYAFFNAHTPHVMYAMNGKSFISRRDGIQLNDEIYSKCFKFVIDTALAFREDDFDFDAWSARQAKWSR